MDLKAVQALEREAEDLCRPSLWKKLMGGVSYDEAADKYLQAANSYKVNKQWVESERCFARSAEIALLGEDRVSAANAYVDAGNMAIKTSAKSAESLYTKACSIYTSAGRFAQAGKLMKQLAEEYNSTDVSAAKSFYKKAAEYYDLDEFSKSNYSQCIMAYANLVATVDRDYGTAIRIYEEEGNKALKNTLLQYNAKECFFKAVILHLCQEDAITASVAMEQYRKLDPRFAESRLAKLSQKICEAVEKDDVKLFSQAVADFDHITPLDQWKISMLAEIKSKLTPQQEDQKETHTAAIQADDFVAVSGGVDLT
ncbi:putative alpha-soluble NSF attachment protein [Gregarina niphandrodes]|uniref:Alpha-soluble NSF attachment protein n=1 Tax=Gregarina niphandrodes TaxID=110365 RepID=A0A023BD37_GRENI|nr:putative alpha-soluble NSF attachment protein [Gregarina niphandrodes]EZG86039.1 putative alpha-soluble NSF attachment protein [Gregarina niphandrodes]|eukprot:XP_011128794.1 putative alpha-soluble NSF attachment protein [Gregarina niphandrodes]